MGTKEADASEADDEAAATAARPASRGESAVRSMARSW